MATIAKLTKIEEGSYSAESLACPACKQVLVVTITSQSLWLYNNRALAQEVFPTLSDEDRERFVSGYCGPCWDNLFPEEEED